MISPNKVALFIIVNIAFLYLHWSGFQSPIPFLGMATLLGHCLMLFNFKYSILLKTPKKKIGFKRNQ